MKRSTIVLWTIVAAALVIPATLWVCLPLVNGYKKDGTLILPGLSAPVKIMRDEKGMAYLYAQGLADAVMAQGFATAQDRLFQMQVTRLLAQGRISELVGEKGRAGDVRMRTIGIHRNARKHADMLDASAKAMFGKYVDGVNSWIRLCPNDVHKEFKVAGIQPEPWTVADCLSIAYYMGWITSANVATEITAQMLVDRLGLERAREIFPLNVNPDEPPASGDGTGGTADHLKARLNFDSDTAMVGLLLDAGEGRGSNNWVVSPGRSKSGKPIVANDPHLEARMLPGVWYSSGIITPDFRAVGATIPGVPGMVIGRTDRVAAGVTNSYGDCQDLYVEQIDPADGGRYLEGQNSLPFHVITERLRIRDKSAESGYRHEEVDIKLTRRGPVVSGVLGGLGNEKVITLRWAAAETMAPALGLDKVLTARNATELRECLKHLNFIVLNWVFADTDGNIGWHVSGRLPIRSQGDSTLPYAVKDDKDNWIGWIGFDQMPHAENPPAGWVGTCNHKTVRSDYPYYFSSHFAPSYRQARLQELMADPKQISVDECWSFQRDTANLMARAIVPVMVRSLSANPETREMAQVLKDWNRSDDPDQLAPVIYHLVFRNFFRLTFQDELGDAVTDSLLKQGYFWKERLQRMILAGSVPLSGTGQTKNSGKTVDRLFQQAAVQAAKTLKSLPGTWGKLHQIEFVNPIRREGFGKSFLGGGKHPMGGSRDTLYCAYYDYDKPFEVILAASLRMVADLGDDHKIAAVLPGGVTGRAFDPHQKDQIEPFMRGDKVYWWFSDDAINRNSRNLLLLTPK
jgi:penicillin G amidase